MVQSGAVPATFADDDLGYEKWLTTPPGQARGQLRPQPEGRVPDAPPVLLPHHLRHPCRGDTWTGGADFKLCADSIAELEAWAR